MQKILILTTLLIVLVSCGKNNQSNNIDDVSQAMKDFPCHKMGGVWMGQCEFDENGNPILEESNNHHSIDGEKYNANTQGLPYAKKPIMVSLRDGDNYEMSASFVQQEIGGRTLRRLAYNGMIPGPIFQVPQGAKVTLSFTNNIDEPTTIHSHGLRGDYTMDGVPDMPHKALEPGESFAYQLEFPDAGIFWYHPHVREDRQQDGGLYGNYIVESNDPNYWTTSISEQSWILDDLSLEDYLKDTITHTIMGRFGDIQFINNEENFSRAAKAGETIRYFITNTANVRPFRLKIPGAKMKIVGGDLGRIEHEQVVGETGLTIAPAERWIVEVYYPSIGSYSIQNNTPDGVVELGSIDVSEVAEQDSKDIFNTLKDNSDDFIGIRNYISEISGNKPDKKLRIDIDMPMMGHSMGHGEHGQIPPIEWNDGMKMMNARSTDKEVTWKLIDEDTGNINDAIDWKFEVGEKVVIEIFNDPDTMHPMQHPIHFHGQRFLIIERDGKLNSSLQWKDTTLLKTGERIRILLENTNPGIWMAHCHISEHMHAGMMFNFIVGEYEIPKQKH